jgi:hypothetical protein
MRCYFPFADFTRCAECFDNRRLTKQKHAVMEIIYMLKGQRHPSRGDRFFYNSPARKVWQHYPRTLCEYGLAMCAEWERRTGKSCPVKPRIQEYLRYVRNEMSSHEPTWVDNLQMHKSHRAILARLEPEHYAKFGWESTPDDEKVFYWPVDEVEAIHGTIVRDTRRRENNDDDNDDDNDRDDTYSDNDDSDSDCSCELCQAARG